MQNQIKREFPNLIIKGTFLGAHPAEQRNQWTIRKFAVDSSYYSRNGEYIEQVYVLEMFGDNSTSLDSFKKGDKVIVRFNLRPGKDQETDKWRWINVSPWKIEIDTFEQGLSETRNEPMQQPVTTIPVSSGETQEDEDDLPF